MAKILIIGGGFGGVMAAESLAKQVSEEHQITLVSRSRKFLFYPDLVHLAFGKCEPDDISFDLREAMLDRRIRFLEGEVARVDPHERRIIMAHGEIEGDIPYDYLIFALGRRLATEQIGGFFEHANHLLTVEGALEFGEIVKGFHEGRAVIGQCPGACHARGQGRHHGFGRRRGNGRSPMLGQQDGRRRRSLLLSRS